MSPASRNGTHQPDASLRTKQNLLVVEDEVLLRLAACDVLRDAGYNVFEAATAEEARAILGTVAIDLLFVDVQLRSRESDGIVVAQFARDQQPSVEVIVTSGKPLPDNAGPIVATDRFLPKPYLLVRLLELVKAALPPSKDPDVQPGGSS